jgi:type VI secretion system protein ImpH
MANETGHQAIALKEQLLANGHRYAFYQAYRLLRLVGEQEHKDETALRVRPNLTLSFQKSDLDQIVEGPDGNYNLSANFLGLYGVSSPLPTFYTEDLLDEALEDRHGARNFLDIFNQSLYPLFFKAWLKTKLHLRLVEFEDEQLLSKFYAFVGFSQPEKYRHQPGFGDLLRFAGIYTQQPRTALGLKTIVAGIYPGTKIDVIQQDERTTFISADQHCKLGQQANMLGQDSHLGQQLRCRSCNLTISMKNVGEDLFHRLLPGQIEYSRLKFMVRYYLVNPWDVQLKIELNKGVSEGVHLRQGRWASLGRDSWLSPSPASASEISFAI